MNEIIAKNNEKVKDLIYNIRGKQVMLDSDLAIIYDCANGTKTINQAVNRNLDRFPERYRFRLTKEEYRDILRSQIGTLELKKGQYSKYLPYVFTEQGVAMLATIIKTDVASQISIRIMDAFVYMREQLRIEHNLNYKITNMETRIIHFDNKIDDLDNRVNLLFDKFKTKNNYLFFNGEYYDAYSLLVDILGSCKNEIIVIDNYIDKNILDVICKVNKKVIIVTKEYNYADIDKYRKQYSNIKIIKNSDFHDRFIMIDRKILYLSGSSLKDYGKKTFSITKIEDVEWIEKILNKINI